MVQPQSLMVKTGKTSPRQPRCHRHKVAQGKGRWSALLSQQGLSVDQDLIATLRFPQRPMAMQQELKLMVPTLYKACVKAT